MSEAPRFLPAFLTPGQQETLLDVCRDILGKAPPFRPTMPRSGQAFSVLMSNCGSLGWVSDRNGYRYQPTHPQTQEPWPEMPNVILDIWGKATGCPFPPEACLINLYSLSARMGLHRDADEEALNAPVVSISLGAGAMFRFGGLTRKEPSRAAKLSAGDLVILEGKSRMIYHGIDRLLPGPDHLIDEIAPKIARINLTLRRVTKPT